MPNGRGIPMWGLTERDISRTRMWLLGRIVLRFPCVPADDVESVIDECMAFALATYDPGRGMNPHTWLAYYTHKQVGVRMRRDLKFYSHARFPDGDYKDCDGRPDLRRPAEPGPGFAELLTAPELTARQRQVLTMRFVQGMGWRQIANSIGLSLERARQIGNQGLRIIRRQIERQERELAAV